MSGTSITLRSRNHARPDPTQRVSGKAGAIHYALETAAPEPSLTGMVEFLKSNPEQRPEMVARLVADLIDKPHGERPFRVVADRTGMGVAIVGYNELLGQVTRAIYAANGMNEDLLSLNSGPT